eukprot:1953256-Rhodomonas_salina.1
MSGTGIAYGAACYAKSGTDMAYGATRSMGAEWCYAFPVLIKRMMLRPMLLRLSGTEVACTATIHNAMNVWYETWVPEALDGMVKEGAVEAVVQHPLYVLRVGSSSTTRCLRYQLLSYALHMRCPLSSYALHMRCPLSHYALPTRCLVLPHHHPMLSSYAIPGTEIGYAATRQGLYALRSLAGTVDSRGRVAEGGGTVPAYARPTECLVLTDGMLLPGIRAVLTAMKKHSG